MQLEKDFTRARPPGPGAGRCEVCGGTGFAIVSRGEGGRSYARRCRCAQPDRARILLERARIPRQYAGCNLRDFFVGPEFHPSIEDAWRVTKEWVAQYTVRKVGEGSEYGLLYLGRPGVGKTHLAVAALQALIEDQGVDGLFADFRELIKTIQASYDPKSPDSEYTVLRPLIRAEVLVLDDLGAFRVTEWVRDMVGHIVSSRYNDKKVTIITSNVSDDPGGRDAHRPALIDRVGDAVMSRLHEMCETIHMEGKDHRRTKIPSQQRIRRRR